MKNKQTYRLRASFALLAFVILGYMVKFYPETVEPLDTTIQTFLRGDLPIFLTSLFQRVTVLGDPLMQGILVLGVTLWLYIGKGWKIEGLWVAFSGVSSGLLIVLLKLLYQRSRPLLEHLVEAHGYSFPSGHSLGAFLILGSLWMICHQRLPKGLLRVGIKGALTALILLIGLSRIYLGVHYPTDVVAGFLLAYAVLNASYPFYDQKRFEWRFQGKQP